MYPKVYQWQGIIFLLYLVGSLFVINDATADILITKLDDVDAMATPGRANDLTLTERLCIGSNPAGPFSLRATGSGIGGRFTIENGPYAIPFATYIQDRVSGGSFMSINPGIPVTGLRARSLNPNNRCRGNPTQVRIVFSNLSFSGAPAGIYRGTLQLSVIPE